jgi:acetolactate synthase-1/2/3 large subunit
MAALEAASGIPVVGMESPRGLNDPALGAFAEVVAEADGVVLLGKRRDFTLKFGKAFAPGGHVVKVDAQVGALPALEAMAHGATPHPSSDWLAKVRTALAYRPAGWDANPTARLLRSLQPVLDEHRDSVLVCDGGEFGQWAQACLTAPHRVINGVAGSIGAGLPFAVAARCALPQAPVIAVMGDGTFGFHPAEIDTAVRYGLPFVVVVGNDARWNAEYQIQLRAYGRERLVGCELRPTRYDEVARAFGGYGEHVGSPEEVLPAVRRAIASGLAAVVDVTIEGAAWTGIRRSG